MKRSSLKHLLLALCLAPLLWPLEHLAERYYRSELAGQNRQTLDLYVANLLGTLHRYETLPQILDSAVLDLEQGEAAETARLNGYLHAVAAFEPKPDSEWLQLTFRFVDQDAQKLDYISRLIARGTAQKHFVPGA